MKKYDFLCQLKEREKLLTKEIKKRKQRLEKAPEGMLRIAKKGKRYQYFRRMDHENNGTYIKKVDSKLVLMLAQKKYDSKFVADAEAELKLIRRFLGKYPERAGRLSAEFPWELKLKMDIAEMTDEEYGEYWQNMEYTPKKIDDGVPYHITAKGERVRSKSEELIANALYSKGIPYKYECPVKIYNGEVRYPDFTILNPRTREITYLEHLGMIDNMEYVAANMNKLRDYEKSGIFLGKELLITVESAKMPLNSGIIAAFINKHFS